MAISNENITEFYTWFDGFYLDHLEDVRDYVAMHALDNAAGSEDVVTAARATVRSYVDDKDNADEVFAAYR